MAVPRPDSLVVEQWRALLPTAYLLTGSDAAARELLARGLARPGPGEDDRSRVVAGLVRAHLRRRVRGEGTVTGTSSAPWWSFPADAEAARRLSAALDRLSRAERTVVVLARHEGLPPDRVAALVPGVEPDAAVRALADEVPDPADLPARLDVLAAQCDTSTLTDETAVLDVAAVRSRRWRRAGLAVVTAAAVATAVVLLPDVLPSTAAPASTADEGLVNTPARGSLAGDGDFLDAVRTSIRTSRDASGPGPSAARVVYAGDVDGVRAVLLVQQEEPGVSVTWLTGPAGADVDQLTGASTTSSQLPSVAAVGLSADRTAPADRVLVVGAPGDEVEVSPGLDVLPDGTATRTFTPAEVTDGTAVVEVRSDARAARVRVVRNDEVLGTTTPSTSGGPLLDPEAVDGAGSTPLDGPTSRSGDPAVSALEVDLAVDTITTATGWLPADLDVTVLGAGTYPQAGGTSAQAVTVAAVLPDGSVVSTTSWAVFGSQSISTGTCGSTAYPAGTDPATLTVVARCSSYAGDGSTFGVTLLVAAPPGVPVELNSAAGGSPVTPELTDGWGFVIADADALTEFAAGGTTGQVSREGADLFSG